MNGTYTRGNPKIIRIVLLCIVYLYCSTRLCRYSAVGGPPLSHYVKRRQPTTRVVLTNDAWLKYYFLLGKNAAETVVMMQIAYKEHALNKTQVYKWFARIKRGEMTTEDQPHYGRPSSVRTEDVAQIPWSHQGRSMQNNRPTWRLIVVILELHSAHFVWQFRNATTGC